MNQTVEQRAFRVRLGANIQRARRNRCLTRIKLSELSGISLYALCATEKGRRDTPPEQLHQIASAMGIPDYNEFFDDTPALRTRDEIEHALVWILSDLPTEDVRYILDTATTLKALGQILGRR